MPAPAKTSGAAIVSAARALLEAGGPDAVTMNAVAAAVGVRPPSLYKRFRDRAGLLAAVELAFFDEIAATLAGAGGAAPRARLEAQARAYRTLALANPRTYALINGTGASLDPEHDAARAEAIRAAIAPMRAIVGEARALTALRTLTGFIHGFVSMEAAGLFRLGGDVEADYRAGLAMILDGIEASAPRPEP